MYKKRQSPSPSKNSEQTSMVRRSTMFLMVLIALVGGLYIGTLIPLSSDSVSSLQTNNSADREDDESLKHIADAKSFADANPNNASAWVHLGNLYFGRNMHEESVLAYTKALELEPNNADVITDRGVMYRRMKKFDLALASFRRASQIDPKHETSLFNAGIVLYFDLNKKEEAKVMWNKVLSINPNAAPNGKSLKEFVKSL